MTDSHFHSFLPRVIEKLPNKVVKRAENEGKNMGLIRKRYSPELKAKIGLAAIKELVPLNEMASEEGVHLGQITQWKKTILDSLSDIF